MINLVIVSILVIITAICKSISDTLADHYKTSIFSNKNRKYWDKSISWVNKYIDGDPAKGLRKIKILGIKMKVFTPLTDAWHLFNSIQIITLLLLPFFPLTFPMYIDIAIYFSLGLLHILIFNTFYNHFLKK